ncbi:putative small nuclear ribonucleoprotein G [Toxoplasma gondii TgCatPRC2]|uniref:Small nuclear ribonucleoprotein G n=14 Tax=Toxoplasma gondii TaxID=5811 RepID=B9PIY4_TOXGV|nr:small nuclear ribonucleoprotein G, putative [Toxoplasma gondii ME49]EPR58866.1 putative small nuclear ribonucleoprotein G [Toxoplasma gondii GT1]ESS35404.1 putative small nuclear ribonucleoprotein G [Toxoplasma gondii VEG]KFG37006.1 putative small nuclear ribonucleoprotein G [Toxoplasma gondii GAB2-2007-GAL-DOM2]KFG49730.1 putative small nuclear ribonucleoprotein G [Toxoplasma gondii p89]KFG56275.1 putative small nuclear ribonucleoprotein G [Toxoplasma gondii FOU]KFG66273.1 putative small |eukprot:XP_008883462.1 small nuclear ribonucleoprotein G, putative [Hammondia hammondi]
MPGVMGKAGPAADLRRFMEKRLDVHLSGGRRVVGVLRGYDTFMNIVLENTVEVKGNPANSASSGGTETNEIGFVVVRGNSILYWECLDKVRTW